MTILIHLGLQGNPDLQTELVCAPEPGEVTSFTKQVTSPEVKAQRNLLCAIAQCLLSSPELLLTTILLLKSLPTL